MGRHCLTTILIALVAVFPHVTQASNNYPIVLVHGLAGWSRSEFAGFKYWGGFHGDYQESLKRDGFQVYSAAVGPFSSNWDRACELYAQIKGGTVDYGANHSATHGHARYGRTYPGFLPQWGQVVNGKVQKVHLIGHSMGGTTIRMLAQLLNGGDKGAGTEEVDPPADSLFAGGKDWVHSITTVSTPNQGSVYADKLTKSADTIENLVAGIFSLLGSVGDGPSHFYDAKLDQWGIHPKQEGESLSKYLKRVVSSKMFAPGFKDISAYSLTTYGTQAENEWVQTVPTIYYYSMVTHDTFAWRDWSLRKIELPHPFSMSPILVPAGTLIGSRYTTTHGFDETWQSNDGLVSTPSQISDGHGKVESYTGRSTPGTWHVMQTLHFVDHLGMIGLKLFHNAYSVYQAHAGLLASLPAQEETGKNLRTVDDSEDHVQQVFSAFQAEIMTAQTEWTRKQCAKVSETDTAMSQLCDQFKHSLRLRA